MPCYRVRKVTQFKSTKIDHAVIARDGLACECHGSGDLNPFTVSLIFLSLPRETRG